MSDFTVSQHILIASQKLEEQGQVPFTAEALAVAAWKQSPKTFGLKGFTEQYPDCNRVYACLMGERGLCKRGWLVKVGQKLYTLSKQGKEEARRCLQPGDSPLPKRRVLTAIKVPKEYQRHLQELFLSTAYRRFKDGLKREITYKDACRFWNLLDSTSGESVDTVLNIIPTTLDAVDNLINGTDIELTNGQSVSKKELATLREIHTFLTQQFARHLAQQKDRARKF